jgi:hypothetical protein
MSTDVDTLIRRSARLEVDDIDFSAFSSQPLDAGALRCLRYMHDVEHHTVCYLRDLLVTRAHRDPEVTDFLCCWVYEEHWHGDALAKVLEAHGELSGSARVLSLRRRLPRSDAFRPLLFGLGSAVAEHMVTVQMAWGAVNEWTTQAGYGRLASRSGHPVLSELLRRIMRQEGRHIDFYSGQARRRLADSPAARRLTRLALRRWWTPVGAGVMPAEEVDFLSSHLFGGTDGLATTRRVDRAVDRLPGLEGLRLLERSTVAVTGGRK